MNHLDRRTAFLNTHSFESRLTYRQRNLHDNRAADWLRIVADGVDLHGDLLIRDGTIADFGASLGRPDGCDVVHEDGAAPIVPALARLFWSCRQE